MTNKEAAEILQEYFDWRNGNAKKKLAVGEKIDAALKRAIFCLTSPRNMVLKTEDEYKLEQIKKIINS